MAAVSRGPPQVHTLTLMRGVLQQGASAPQWAVRSLQGLLPLQGSLHPLPLRGCLTQQGWLPLQRLLALLESLMEQGSLPLQL